LWRSSIVPSHGNVDAGLLQKHPIVGVHRLHVLVIGVPLGLDLGGVTFCRVMALLFRVSWSVSRVRCRLDWLGVM
jgi:hypothetical protein